MSNPTTIVLAYWPIRGLAEHIRVLLRFGNIAFEDKTYPQGDAPDFDKSSWLGVKHTVLGDYPSPNLPYLLDGKRTLTQSNAILRYLGRRLDLMGQTAEQQIMVDVLLEEIMDMRFEIFDVGYSSDYEKLHPGLVEAMHKRFKSLNKCLQSSPWLAGDVLTVADFFGYETIMAAEAMVRGILAQYSRVAEFITRFKSQPQISAYLSSDEHTKKPFHSKYAYTSIHKIC